MSCIADCLHAYEVGRVVRRVEKLVRHVLVGVELVVEVVAVENQHTFEGLQLKGKAAAEPLRFDPDIVCYITGDFGNEGIVNLGGRDAIHVR